MITICTIGVGDCAGYAELTNENKAEYCKKRGYELVCCSEILDFRATSVVQQAVWSKFVLMKRIIDQSIFAKKYNQEYQSEFVVWMDNDMWIFNMDLKLENLFDNEHELFVSPSINGLNLGVFAMPCNQNSIDLLNDWLGREKWLNHVWSESMAVNEWYSEGNHDKAKLIDRQIWNTFLHETHRIRNVIHLAAESPNDRYGYFLNCKNGVIK